jgi:hypothetical protein
VDKAGFDLSVEERTRRRKEPRKEGTGGRENRVEEGTRLGKTTGSRRQPGEGDNPATRETGDNNTTRHLGRQRTPPPDR